MIQRSGNLLYMLLLILIGFGFSEKVIPGGKEATTTLQTTINSKILNQEREVYIALPESYGTSSNRYPILFTLYNGEAGFTHSSSVISHLYDTQKAPEMILISVSVDGMRDLTPTQTPSYGPTSGGADHFIRFFKEELVPLVEKNYRTTPHRIFWSHSIGGTLGIYAFLSESELFFAVLTSSPFFLYDRGDRFLLKNTKQLLKKRSDSQKNYLYIIIGDEPELKQQLDEFERLLKNINPPGLEWDYTQMKSETHQSIQSKSLGEGLKALFSKKSRIPGSWHCP
ncbi:alpha/beta hydrolase [Acidobacteriota bacterium]